LQPLDEILKIIKEDGISIARISKDSGVSSSKLYSLKEGRGKPKGEDYVNILKWLDNYKNKNIEVTSVSQLELVKIKANIQALNQIVARNMAQQTGKPIQECLNEIVEITQTNLTNLSL